MTSAIELRDFFASVFAELDARPREMTICLTFESEVNCQLKIEKGEPIFVVGEDSCNASFRKRWIAEHPVPLTLKKGMRLVFVPTTGNRVKVRV